MSTIDIPTINLEGESLTAGRNQNPSEFRTCDNKISYVLPGCFHPQLTPFSHIESFCVFNNYAMPLLDTFVCEFMAYYFWSLSEMIAHHLTNVYDLAGVKNYVAHHNINNELPPDALIALQESFSTNTLLLQEKNATFHQIAARLMNRVDDTDTDAATANNIDDESEAANLLHASTDLVIATFFTMLARVYIARFIRKPELLAPIDAQSDPLIKMAYDLIKCTTHKERRAVYLQYSNEQFTSMLVKNLYDDNVQELLETSTDLASSDVPLYVIPTIGRFFEDLVVHTVYLIASPKYLDSMSAIQNLFNNRPTTGVKRKHTNSAESDDTTALQWFVSSRAKCDENAGNKMECSAPETSTDLLTRRGVEYEIFRKLIDEVLNKY